MSSTSPLRNDQRNRSWSHEALVSLPARTASPQVELLRRRRAGDESALRPLLRSIAGIAAALRNTG